jgi:phosphate transport system permease protein
MTLLQGRPSSDITQEVPVVTASAADDVPNRRVSVDRENLIEVGFSALAALVTAGLLRTLLDWHGVMSTFIWAYLLFILAFYLLQRDRSSYETAVDRGVTVAIWSAAVLVVAVLAWILGFLVAKGLPALRPAFFTQDLSKVGPLNPGGGARHAIIGTFEQVGLATLVVVPLAVLTAVYLHEIKGRLSGPIRFIVDAMSGLPSIVAGLLIFTIWVEKHGFSGISGSAALAILMLPLVTRTSEEILRTIPDSLREASLALGAPEWRVTMRVVLPTAISGLVTATILGVARAVGETAPMLLTAFGNTNTNTNLLHGPQADLPLFVWQLIRQPNHTQNERAWTGALVLVILVLILFVAARVATSIGQRKLGRGR